VGGERDECGGRRGGGGEDWVVLVSSEWKGDEVVLHCRHLAIKKKKKRFQNPTGKSPKYNYMCPNKAILTLVY
jgi:hypothetical protein